MKNYTTETKRTQSKEKLNLITEAVIGSAIEVHRCLGPGLLESAYEACLAEELSIRKIAFEQQKPLPIIYKGKKIDCGYRLDFVIDRQIVLELKAVEALLPIHHAQLLTYLKLGNWSWDCS